MDRCTRPPTAATACLVGIVAFLAQPIGRLRARLSLSAFIVLLVGVGLLVISLDSYRIHGATMRYQLDYAPMLLMAAVLGWIMFSQRLQKGTRRYLLVQTCAVLVVAWSAFFSIAIIAYPCAGTGSC